MSAAVQRAFNILQTLDDVRVRHTRPGAFRRLSDGSWGIHGWLSDLIPGRRIPMKKFKGELTVVTVGKVIWRGTKFGLAVIMDDPPKELLA